MDTIKNFKVSQVVITNKQTRYNSELMIKKGFQCSNPNNLFAQLDDLLNYLHKLNINFKVKQIRIDEGNYKYDENERKIIAPYIKIELKNVNSPIQFSHIEAIENHKEKQVDNVFYLIQCESLKIEILLDHLYDVENGFSYSGNLNNNNFVHKNKELPLMTDNWLNFVNQWNLILLG